MIRDIDDATLRAEAADASTPVVIDLHAPWCGYCLKTRPHLERLAEERADVRFLGVDTDDHPDAFADWNVRTLPAIILLKDGVEIARRGSGDYESLAAWLAENGI